MHNVSKEKVIMKAPVKGKMISINEVKDEVFSAKMIGDGFAAIAENGDVFAPVDGEIKMIFPTKHAFAIATDFGMEVMVHIGIETINEKGNGFTVLKEIGDYVKAGEKIVHFNYERLCKSYDMTVITVITNSSVFSSFSVQILEDRGEAHIEYGK